MRVLITKIDYQIQDNIPLIHIYGRKAEGGFYHGIVTDFEPYFYVPYEFKNKLKSKAKRIEDVKVTDMTGRRVVKVITNLPKEVAYFRRFVPLHYEADVLFSNRFRIDLQLNNYIEVPDGLYLKTKDIKKIVKYDIKPRLGYFDIETWDKEGVPEPTNPKDAIYNISYFDSYEKKYYLFTYTKWDKKIIYDNMSNKFDFEFRNYENEVDMLRNFVKFLKVKRPDYLLAWNVNFDFDYTNARLNELNLPEIPKSINKFDLLAGFKKLYGKKLVSGKLDYVANMVLGKKKMDVGRTWQLEEKDKLYLLYSYNLIDTYLIVQIDKIKDIFGYYSSLSDIIGCDINDTHYNSKAVDLYVLHNTHDKFVLPSKQFVKKREEGYKGGSVSEPQMGMFNYVDVIDLKSLYPTIMLTFNMGPDTITKIKGNTFNLPNASYRKDRKSIIYDIIKNLIFQRDLLKADMKKLNPLSEEYKSVYNHQRGLKFLVNSIYGVLGSDVFRLSLPVIAKDITAVGRMLKEYIATIVKNMGYSVIYGDSVSNDSKLLILKDNKIRFMKIEDLFGNVDYIKDGKEYCNLDDVYTITLSDKGKISIKPIKYVMRHKVNKQMYRLNMTNAWHLDITEDHSVYGYKFVRNLDINNISSYILPFKPVDFGKKTKSIITINGSILNKSNVSDLGKKFWNLIGMLLGDGNWGWKYYGGKYYAQISLGNDENELLQKILIPLKDCGVLHNYYKKGNKGDYTLLNKNLVTFLGYFKVGKQKVIPQWINDLPYEYISAFLSGYISVDGSVSKKGEVSLCSVNINLIERVQELLWLLGISSSYFVENKPNNYKGKILNSYSYHLGIKDNIRFRDEVGIIIDRKSNRLSDYKYGNSKSKFSHFDFDKKRLVDVHKIDYDDYVYDIEVEDTHRFFANGILVHNTDSSMFISGKNNVNDAVIAGQEVIKMIKSKFIDFAKQFDLNENDKSFFDIKLEKVYKKWFQAGAKKRYVGLVEWNGKNIYSDDIYELLDVKGFEIKRANVSPITKKVQKDIIVMAFSDKINDIKAYILNLRKEVYDGKWDIDLFIPASLSKDVSEYKSKGAHVRALTNSINRGIIDKNMLRMAYKWVYCLRPDDVMAIPLEAEKIPDNIVIDRVRMFERNVLKPIEPILLGLNIDLNNQTKLEDWF